MELPNLGKQCEVSTCQMLDFLPIKCHFCSLMFCKDHFPPQYHNCTGDYDKHTEKLSADEKLRYSCDHQSCKNWELAPVICPGCTKNFCLLHRHQVDHECSAYKPPVNPMAEAAAKVKEITDKMDSTASKKGQGRRSDKLAAKVQLMKLKQKAAGQTDLPQEERLYFLIFLPKSHSSPTQAVFVSHHWSIGKATDAIATLSKVPNRNNVSGADKLVLFRSSDGSRLSTMDVKLKDLVDEQQLFSGQTLIMEYVPMPAEHLDTFEDYKIL